ncbi:MAG: hypothetical protein MUE72_13210 [Chitinophagaceae bacterium]|jgi:hypothetical protein|nr:hypothetical protein [Chitinophagaceae bacterium]
MKNLIIIVFAFLLGACNKEEHIIKGEEISKSNYQIIYQDVLYKSRKFSKGILVFKNEQSWNNFKNDLDIDLGYDVSKNIPKIPIDFNTNQVVFVLGKEHPSVASIEISKVIKKGNDIIINVFEVEGMLYAISSPYLICVVPRVNGNTSIFY